jgi:hypothetical protein
VQATGSSPAAPTPSSRTGHTGAKRRSSSRAIGPDPLGVTDGLTPINLKAHRLRALIPREQPACGVGAQTGGARNLDPDIVVHLRG